MQMNRQFRTDRPEPAFQPGNADSAIAATDLTRCFGNVRAVDGLCLHVPRDSIYAFLGPNGAGKTTTIRMLLRLTRPDRGEIRIFEQAVDHRNRRAILRRIGSLVEEPSLYPHLTGYENLQITQELVSLDRTSIDRALRIVRLENDAQRLVRTYSQGMRQRLGVALALLAEPELLILDEPTNGLDPAGMIEMREMIRRMPGEHGITVFLSSHLLGEVEQMATHVGIIGRGRLLFEGTLGSLQNRSRHRVLIETDSPAIACEILAQAGWTPQDVGDSGLTVHLPDRQSIAHAVAALGSAGCSLYQIRSEQPSLEDLFLDLTRETGLGFPSSQEVFDE
jgi:ABC-type multidrug transport system ATPase subunit